MKSDKPLLPSPEKLTIQSQCDGLQTEIRQSNICSSCNSSWDDLHPTLIENQRAGISHRLNRTPLRPRPSSFPNSPIIPLTWFLLWTIFLPPNTPNQTRQTKL